MKMCRRHVGETRITFGRRPWGESRHHVSFWNLVQVPEQWAAARARAYQEMGLPAEPGHALERLRTEFDAALHDFRAGLPDNRFAKVEAGALRLSKRDAPGSDGAGSRGARPARRQLA